MQNPTYEGVSERPADSWQMCAYRCQTCKTRCTHWALRLLNATDRHGVCVLKSIFSSSARFVETGPSKGTATHINGLRDDACKDTHTFVEDCKAQPTCKAGQKIVNNTKTMLAACVACDKFTYWLDAGQRPATCLKQAECNSAEFLSTLDLDKKGVCKVCGANTYKTEKNRDTSCDDQPKCKPGEKLSGANNTTKGSCVPCGSSEYQEKINFQGSCTTTSWPTMFYYYLLYWSFDLLGFVCSMLTCIGLAVR